MADPEVKTDGPALSPLEEPADIGPEPSPRGCSGCSWKVVLVLGIVLGVLLAMLFPAVQAAREASRRMRCNGIISCKSACQSTTMLRHRRYFRQGTVCAGSQRPPATNTMS